MTATKHPVTADPFIITIQLRARTLNVKAGTEESARTLASLLSHSNLVSRITIHAESPRGLQLLLDLGR